MFGKHIFKKSTTCVRLGNIFLKNPRLVIGLEKKLKSSRSARAFKKNIFKKFTTIERLLKIFLKNQYSVVGLEKLFKKKT